MIYHKYIIIGGIVDELLGSFTVVSQPSEDTPFRPHKINRLITGYYYYTKSTFKSYY